MSFRHLILSFFFLLKLPPLFFFDALIPLDLLYHFILYYIIGFCFLPSFLLHFPWMLLRSSLSPSAIYSSLQRLLYYLRFFESQLLEYYPATAVDTTYSTYTRLSVDWFLLSISY